MIAIDHSDNASAIDHADNASCATCDVIPKLIAINWGCDKWQDICMPTAAPLVPASQMVYKCSLVPQVFSRYYTSLRQSQLDLEWINIPEHDPNVKKYFWSLSTSLELLEDPILPNMYYFGPYWLRCVSDTK